MKWVTGAALMLMLGVSACGEESIPSAASIREAYEQSALSQARDLARRALKADPDNPELQLLSGQIAVQTDNAEYAIGVLAPLLTQPAFADRARPWLAKAQLLVGNARQALEVLGDRAPQTGLAASVGVVAHSMLGRLDEADRLFLEARQAFPNAIEVLALEGNNALGRGDVGRAAAIAEHILKVGPKSIDAHMFAARVALARQQLDVGEKHLDWVLVARPDFGAALVAKGTIRHDKGDVKGAEAAFLKASGKSNEAALIAQYFRARIEFDKGREDKARDILQTINNPSIFPPAARLSGILAARSGQNEQAIRLLKAYIDNGGEDPQSRFALASAFGKVGQPESGWRYLQPLIQSPVADASVLGLASQLARTLNMPVAESLQSRLASVSQKDARAPQFLEAEAAMKRGDWEAADTIYTVMLNAEPATSNKVLLNNAAYARQQLGDLNGAQLLIERALRATPNDPILLDTAGWIAFKKDGPTPQALSFIRRARSAMPGHPEIEAHAKAIEAAVKTNGGAF